MIAIDIVRTFVAIELPEVVKRGIAEIKNQYSDMEGVSWIKPEGAHLTIKFLGEIGRDVVDGLACALEPVMAKVKPFKLKIEDVGVFPNLSKPRVLWLGVKEEKNLKQIHLKVDEEARKVGINKEEKNYHPHITIARIKSDEPPQRLKEFLKEFKGKTFWTDVDVKSIVIYKSILRPDGAEYEKLYEIPLLGGEK
jgi:2'-5' RNA ligase